MPIEQTFSKVRLEEETHTYYVDSEVYKSVSSRIEEVTPKFPAELVASKIAQKSNETQEEILEKWRINNRRAINLGNNAHEFGENYTEDSIPMTTRDLGICQWWEQLDDRYEVFCLEHPIYYEDGELAGTPDILLRDTTNDTLVIADYKTNKDLFKHKGNASLSYPFEAFKNTNFNKYTIQLNYYQFMLKQAGYKVSQRLLIWLKFDEVNLQFFQEYEVPWIQHRVSSHEFSRHAEAVLSNV